MFKPTVPKKTHSPLFQSDAYPERKPKKVAQKLPQSLNSYDIIRDKVINEMEPKAVVADAKKPEKKSS